MTDKIEQILGIWRLTKKDTKKILELRLNSHHSVPGLFGILNRTHDTSPNFRKRFPVEMDAFDYIQSIRDIKAKSLPDVTRAGLRIHYYEAPEQVKEEDRLANLFGEEILAQLAELNPIETSEIVSVESTIGNPHELYIEEGNYDIYGRCLPIMSLFINSYVGNVVRVGYEQLLVKRVGGDRIIHQGQEGEEVIEFESLPIDNIMFYRTIQKLNEAKE